jgi:hypothetical protein
MRTKLFFVLLLVTAMAVSCNKEKSDSDTQKSAVYNLPTKAESYIDDNFPDASIEYVVITTNNSAAYLVTLSTTEELAFDKTGGYLGFGSGYHQDQADCDTIYGGHHGGGHHGGGIPVDSLSAAITDYITLNYPEYGIMHARIDSICPEGIVTVVVIGMPDTEPIRLFFGAEDAFLMSARRVHYSDTPQPVKDYISANYPNYHICRKAGELTLPENILQYAVYLKLDSTRQIVRLAEDGTLICEFEPDTIQGGHPGGGHPGGGHHGGGIPLDSLSATILGYIAMNYSGYDIKHAQHGKICPDGEVIEVMISMPETHPVRLVFGTDDAFLMLVTGLPYRDVPQAVQDYIAGNYSDYNTEPMAEKLALPDSSIQFLIHLRLHEMKKRIRIAEDGTFICEQ